MFYFSVDSKEMLDADLKQLESAGIIQDLAFRDSVIDGFQKNFSEYGHSAEDSIDCLNELDSYTYFRVEEESQSDFDGALAKINKHFFFPPQTIWISDEIVYDHSAVFHNMK